ncbi:ABC transporter substrate-binding protein [Candidatus Odyssella thessalonicensis]|uniref:ABC transporter substrate-binding protein n=1 Tax=Candidatus Odyssella thessalonicensis TaxID=84647 RepID=UPI000225C1F9|nr:ABC transporter substrate-binding protein [Candidatus Odyssella thessalonicensis]
MLSAFIKYITAIIIFSFTSGYAKTIGIIQVIEHPALDATRQGLIETLQKLAPDYKVSWYSAQGDMATAVQLTQKFVGRKVAAIVTLGTMPTQVAVRICQQATIPVIFASVTDPRSAGLLGKACGVSNFVDVERQIAAIKEILPRLKRLGIIYNPSEANSEKLLSLTRQACQEKGIDLQCAIAVKTADVAMATQKLVGAVDALFINNDNTALAAFPCVIRVADKAKIPVFASDVDLIKSGALAVLGPDQYRIGIQAAHMVNKILVAGPIFDATSVTYPDSVSLTINPEKMKSLGVPTDPMPNGKEIQ